METFPANLSSEDEWNSQPLSQMTNSQESSIPSPVTTTLESLRRFTAGQNSESHSQPSPVTTTLHKLFGCLNDTPTSQSLSQRPESDSSQHSSIFSPVVKPLFTKPDCSCYEDARTLYIKLRNLTPEEKTVSLSIILPLLNKNDLSVMSIEIVNKISKTLGEHCHDKVKSEAHFFRSKRSRDNDDENLSSFGILTKKLKVEPVHLFFEAATQKSGRIHGEHQEKIAKLQATFYESLMKGVN